MIAQGRPAPGAIGRDALVLGQPAGVEDLLERPPLRLDIGRVHGPVGLIHVHPVAHAGGQVRERVDVAHDRFAALGVERLDAIGLDLGLAVDAEFLLDGQLDRQAVAVPASLARDVAALHGLEPREHVLEHARLDVVRARHAVRGRRTLIEGPVLAAGGLLEGLVERLLLVPERQDVVFHLRQVHLRGDAAIAARGRVGAGFGGGHAYPRRAHVTALTRDERRRPRYHPHWPPPDIPGSLAHFVLAAAGSSEQGVRPSRSSGSSGVMAPSSPCDECEV